MSDISNNANINISENDIEKSYVKSPPLYQVRKIPLRVIYDAEFDLIMDKKEESYYYIKQQDNQLFRHIRNITKDKSFYNKYFIFVDCKSFQKKTEIMKDLIINGFTINGDKYLVSEKSASMSRNSTLGFVRKDISKKLNKIITMDIEIGETVISKYSAYRGLQLSSGFALENYLPKIIVVEDYIKIIPNQKIKYLEDSCTNYIDKETGKTKTWRQKKISLGEHDIEINVFDGAGIHHPEIGEDVQKIINIKDTPTSIMWRAPFMKGLTHSFDYVSFLEDRGVESIIDIFGIEHSIYDKMIIMTESMYKGYKYFYNSGDESDWNDYWKAFKKYDHVLSVAKWNYSFEKEPVMTRMNYQVLQTLEIEYNVFKKLADYSLDWAYKIVSGDQFYVNAFLGLYDDADNNPRNEYTKAILKDQHMLNDPHIQRYLKSLIKKKINDFKCGKIWIEGSFKFLVPDLIMLCEWIGGLEPIGALREGEMYAKNQNGNCIGEHVLERNPHISSSESVILKGIDDNLLDRYCGELANTLMINGYDITTARLSGADFDGDLVLLTNNEIIIKGVNRNVVPIIDIEDKITAKKQLWDMDNIAENTILSFDSRIGELSNIATCYLNKIPTTEKGISRKEEAVDFISICNGKEIDFAKTGVRFHLPFMISKYRGNYPMFMQYAGSYYKSMKQYNNSLSNMNKLAIDINKFEIKLNNVIKNNKKIKFDYSIMQKDNFKIDKNILEEAIDLFKEYDAKMSDLKKEAYMAQNYNKYKNNFEHMTKYEVINSQINWKAYYDYYREKVDNIFKGFSEEVIASYLVEICYGIYAKKGKSFAWALYPNGILKNIKDKKIGLPVRDPNGEYEYLGRRYTIN